VVKKLALSIDVGKKCNPHPPYCPRFAKSATGMGVCRHYCSQSGSCDTGGFQEYSREEPAVLRCKCQEEKGGGGLTTSSLDSACQNLLFIELGQEVRNACGFQ
jgi:hypothetical protein